MQWKYILKWFYCTSAAFWLFIFAVFWCFACQCFMKLILIPFFTDFIFKYADVVVKFINQYGKVLYRTVHGHIAMFLRFMTNERITNSTSFWTQFILSLSLIMIGVWTWRLHQKTCQRDGWAARSLLKTLNLLLPTVKTFVSRLNLPSEFQIPSQARHTLWNI